MNYNELYAIITTFIAIIIILGFEIISLISNVALFIKFDLTPWLCFIPLYGHFLLAECVFGNGFLAFLSLIPLVGDIYTLVENIYLAKAFGKNMIFGIIMYFFRPLRLIIAFDDSSYLGPQKL